MNGGLLKEVRESFSLIALFAGMLALYVGAGLFVARILG